MPGVDHTQKTIESIGSILLDIAGIVASGFSFSGVSGLFKLFTDIKTLVDESSQSLPEVEDLSATDAAKLGEASYNMFKDLVDKVRIS